MLQPQDVHAVLRRHQLADGFPFVLDLERSEGSWLVDARDGARYLDLFTCFASWPIGWNHPGLADPEFSARLARVARHKPSNSDLYTEPFASFVDTFATRVTPAGFEHHFWVSGGALAVENALKVAFDWKARKVGVERTNDGATLAVLHFRQAFHGRSGYTLSVTNTVPDKVALFPKFPWPRVHNPACRFDLDGALENDIEAEEARAVAEIEAAFDVPGRHIAAILIETIQGEGGDNYFRKEFLQRLRRFADEREALLVFDEVQAGFFSTGKPWAFEHFDVRPDVVAFGKKTQVCGLFAGPRVDEVHDNVFRVPSRINSTWGGDLTDMVRSQRMIEIILADGLAENATVTGRRMVTGLRVLARAHRSMTNVRGLGTWVAFTLPSAAERAALLRALLEERVIALASGTASIRFRLSLAIRPADIDEALARIGRALARLAQGGARDASGKG